ncbi:MAG: DinB family protein [Acidobacteria bacterium]|nr:DinB family protein [Acidobacteriota bacterium]
MKKSDINPIPDYYDRYINLVADVELSQAFDVSIKQLDGLDANLLEKTGSKKTAVNKWTAKEILQHVIDWERILAYRTLLFARREGSIPQDIDQNRLAANMDAEKRSIDSIIAELKAVRASTKTLFESFDDEVMLIKGTNWKYEVSILALGFALVGHQIHHLKSIEENYLSDDKKNSLNLDS